MVVSHHMGRESATGCELFLAYVRDYLYQPVSCDLPRSRRGHSAKRVWLSSRRGTAGPGGDIRFRSYDPAR